MYQHLLSVNTGGFKEISDYWDQFNELKMRKGETAMDFIGWFRHVASELKACKDPPSEAQLISTLLKALPNTQDWKDFCRTTQRDIQADDLDFIIREVLQEYRQQSRGDKKNDRDGDDDGGNEAMATMGQGKPRGFVAGAPDHTAIFKRPHLKCNLCGGVGHYRSQCPSKLWTPGMKSANVADEVHMAGLAISGKDYSGPGVKDLHESRSGQTRDL
ncbi:hypothetical protein K435DRAFT_867843 [Dendrothele bispora CBS 962.96]|uniref:CCHC-type domain-containing protein n=1 Tax=Dendrothele bispora (strain CBS 962.96) TaxID=1314807 RepID=A0A4V4HDE1_DENBC|nr:hypothetical protein K435DRAFT_867843 [Dendrothele bispora CBS 962.96]